MIDHRDNRHGHVRPHHVGVRHAEEQHQSHYVTRTHQRCNSKRSFVTRSFKDRANDDHDDEGLTDK